MESKHLCWLISTVAVLMFTMPGTALYAVENTPSTGAEPVKKPAATMEAMDFTLKAVTGQTVTLSQYKGKIVVLEWTNYDCPFVKAHYTLEKQTTAELARKYVAKDVVWLTVNSTYYATAGEVREWAKRLNLPQLILLDSDGKVAKLFDATNTPEIFIFDKEGGLVYKGALDNAPMGKPADSCTVNYADRALGELTSGKEVSIIETRPYGCTVKYKPQNGGE